MRARAERGEVQIGTWITMIRTPGVLTLLQAAGLDFARIDMEHGAFSMETGRRHGRARARARLPAGRAPARGQPRVDHAPPRRRRAEPPRPQVDTPEQALAVARAARYAPLGERGMYGFGPHTGYQPRPITEHMAAANARST